MSSTSNQHVLVTSHHFFDLNRGAPAADYKMFLEYSKYYDATLITYSNLRITDARFARILFPFYVLTRTIFQRIKRNPYTIIHSNTTDASLVLLTFLARSVTVITQSHGLEPYQNEIASNPLSGFHNVIYQLWTKPMLNVSLSKARAVITINKGESNWMRLNYPHTALIDSTVGFDPVANIKQPQKRLIGKTGIYFGRFDLTIKGLDFLVSAVSKLISSGDAEKFIFAGMSIEGQIYIEQELKEHITHIKIFPVFQKDDLPEILSEADFFVVSSRVEGGPIALLEGMSSGLVPIVSNIPFAQMVLGDYFPELIFELEKYTTFESAVRIATSGTINRNLIIERALEFDWGMVLEKRLKLIEEILV